MWIECFSSGWASAAKSMTCLSKCRFSLSVHSAGFFAFLVKLQFRTCRSMASPVDWAFRRSRISAPHLQWMTGRLNTLASTESALNLAFVSKRSPRLSTLFLAERIYGFVVGTIQQQVHTRLRRMFRLSIDISVAAYGNKIQTINQVFF